MHTFRFIPAKSNCYDCPSNLLDKPFIILDELILKVDSSKKFRCLSKSATYGFSRLHRYDYLFTFLGMNKKNVVLLEVAFFVFTLFILQFTSDLQYYLDYGNENLGDTIIYRLLTNPFTILAYVIYYKTVLPFLLKKRYTHYLLLLIAFIFCYDVYLNILDWITAHNPLIPQSLKSKSKALKFEFPRQMFWLTFNHLLALTGLGFFLQKIEGEMKLRKLTQEHLQLELKYLKAQLQPHFFFNTLNNIYSLALHSSPQTAPTVAKLAEMMRYIIYDGNKPGVPLTSEIDFINNYIELERIRHNEKNRISFSVEGKPGDTCIAPLVFIPFVENGFKHGINGSLKDGWMTTRLVITNSEIVFTVRNSKNGHTTKKGGVGLENTKKRLELLYPEKHTLQVTDEGNEFITSLKIDLK